MIPFSVCAAPSPPRNQARTVAHADYLHEILAHAGVCYDAVAPGDLTASLSRLRLLLTVGELRLDEAERDALRGWVEEGGAWISVGAVSGLPELFGVEPVSPALSSWGGGRGTLGEGYLEGEPRAHPALGGFRIPLHYFNGIPVQAGRGSVLARCLDAHGRPTERAAMVEHRPGRGRCLLVAPDVTGAVVRIQQGVAITRDGVSSPDGTGPVADGVLKTDDGAVLDWLLDRQPVPGIPGYHAFLEPVADQWRELLLRAVFSLAADQGLSLPVLWYYPRNLPALGHISHDTDGNDPVKGRLLLEVLAEAEIPSTWCTILPGYEPAIIKDVREAGHELAMHFDALAEDAPFSEEAFDRQWHALRELFGGQEPVTNKNHYLRWQGDTEFFEWCARRSIRLEQSKGASKTGEAGFNFGTCHLYRPVTPAGDPIDILELPTPTQDLVVFAPPAILPPLLDAACRHHGVLHLLFHPAHIDKEGVAEALLEAVSRGRDCGLEWWTGARLSAWENARRQARWTDYSVSGDEVGVTLQVGAGLEGATVLWLRAGGSAAASAGREVERWGCRFQVQEVDLPNGGSARLSPERNALP